MQLLLKDFCIGRGYLSTDIMLGTIIEKGGKRGRKKEKEKWKRRRKNEERIRENCKG
jgi:hypothetical protein